MNFFMLALMLVVVSGKPQYNYPKPSGGSFSPGGNGKPSNGNGGYPNRNNRPSSENSRPSNGYITPSNGNGASFTQNGRPSNGYDSPSNGYGGQTNGNGRLSNGYIPSNGYGSSSNGNRKPGYGSSSNENGKPSNGHSGGALRPDNQESYGEQNFGADYDQPTTIHKNVYVHVPPPELEEDLGPQTPLQYGPPQKSYKIIFIKAPSVVSPAAAYAAQPQREEKTLIYVLVKKPEDAAQISIPQSEPTQPSKPEVFFVRYKPVREEIGQDGPYEGGRREEEANEQPEGQKYPKESPLGGPGMKYLPTNQLSPSPGRSY